MTTAPGTGEVFDLGYQRYSGAREGRRRARRAIFQDGLRISLGMGRSASQKVLPWLFIIIAIGPAVMIVIVAAFASQFGEAGDVLGDFSNRSYYEFALIPLLAFAVAVGPALLCPDRRENVLTLYLVRPMTAFDYVSARTLAFLVVTTALAYVPQVIIFSTLTMTSRSPGAYLTEHWLEAPRFAAAGLVISVFTTSLAMAAASLTDRRAVATAGALGFVLVLAAAAGLLHDVVGDADRYVELLQLPPTVISLNNWIFGEPLGHFGQPAGPLPGIAYLGTVAGFVGLFILIVWRKYGRLRA